MTESHRRAALQREVQAALKAGGNLLIPAFAVERTQELLHDLIALMDQGALPKVPVFLDSPLATRATEVFERYRNRLRLPPGSGEPFRAANVRFVETAEQSMALRRLTGGAIIIAASGMCDAGRIRYHLENNLWRPEATVLFVGYQAAGTLGALLQQGVRTVRIHGQEISVRARLRKLEIYSGHADRRELLAWVRARLPVRRGVFVVHGEETALAALEQGIVGLGMADEQVVIPRLDQTFILHPATKPRRRAEAARPRLDATAAATLIEGRDWHNDYASFVLDLQQALRQTTDDRSRQALLRRLKRALGTD